jgi:succinoglycan biosynthesis protein ExoA
MRADRLPLVSVVIPVKDEGRYIERCLESIAAQDYPRNQIEVIVVDDGSSDHTAELAGNYATFEWASFQVTGNLGRGTAAARNTGIRLARGEVIIQLIGHAELGREYISTAVATLQDKGVDCAGGVIETIGSGFVGKAIATALSSPFAVGNAAFRVGGRAGLVDTVAFGAYRKAVFERIGYFNEESDAGEDDELNYRLLDRGGSIYLNPALRSRYYSRATFDGLLRQYFAYGRAKAGVLAAHPRQVRLRQLAPPALVTALGAGVASGLVFGKWRPLRVLGRVYGGFLAVGTAVMALRNPAAAPLLPGTLAGIHLTYGTGFLKGLGDLLRRRGLPRADDAVKAATRALQHQER